jgi:protein O-GlcNAc transferase
LWARVLCNLPTSRLRMIMDEGDSEEVRQIYLKQFEDAGVPSDRVDIGEKVGYGDYLDGYGNVDIMFDTYPYCGGATTCDAFYMGVPIISLVGEHHFSRVGLSLLSAVELDYFACKDEDEYVAKATVLASNPEALNKIRFQLRQRMMASDMCNPQKQAANMEDAYRQMWRKWCSEQ